MCGGGAGASSWEVPLGMGTEKFAWAEGFGVAGGGGEEDGAVPLPLTGGSRSISIALLPLIAELARAEKRLRSSGGRFNGWMSESNLLLRRDDDVGSVACRESLEVRGDDEDLGEAAGSRSLVESR